MSVFKDDKNGKWGVKITRDGKDYVTHGYKTRNEAREANRQLSVTLDDAGDYEPDYEQTEDNVLTKMLNLLKARKAEKAKDKETKLKLEEM